MTATRVASPARCRARRGCSGLLALLVSLAHVARAAVVGAGVAPCRATALMVVVMGCCRLISCPRLVMARGSRLIVRPWRNVTRVVLIPRVLTNVLRVVVRACLVVALVVIVAPAVASAIASVCHRTCVVHVVAVGIVGVDSEVPPRIPVDRTIEIVSCNHALVLSHGEYIFQIAVTTLPRYSVKIGLPNQRIEVVEVYFVHHLILIV